MNTGCVSGVRGSGDNDGDLLPRWHPLPPVPGFRWGDLKQAALAGGDQAPPGLRWSQTPPARASRGTLIRSAKHGSGNRAPFSRVRGTEVRSSSLRPTSSSSSSALTGSSRVRSHSTTRPSSSIESRRGSSAVGSTVRAVRRSPPTKSGCSCRECAARRTGSRVTRPATRLRCTAVHRLERCSAHLFVRPEECCLLLHERGGASRYIHP